MTQRISGSGKTLTTQANQPTHTNEVPAPLNTSHIAVIQTVVDSAVHESAPVPREPNKQISHWGLYQFHFQDGTRSRHLVGWSGERGRVSTAVDVIHLESMTATTESGRIYGMVGPPGWNSDASYVMGVWMRVNGVVRHKDMTRALLRRKTVLEGDNANPQGKANPTRGAR